MRIQELVPFKQEPLYKDFKQVIDSTKPLLVTKAELEVMLQDHGFKFVGGGHKAVVYEHPNYPWLFKIFARDPAYLRYLDYVSTHQDNPHVPKIRGKVFKLKDNMYGVRLEKLTPLAGGRDLKRALKSLEGTEDDADIPAKSREYLQAKYPGILKIIDDLRDSIPPAVLGWDLHGENIMLRNKTPVIIDPMI